jgi:hypothetical protein
VGDKDNIFPFGAPDYEVGWIWTGDQGLALAWAAESFELTQADWHAVFPGAPYRAKAFQMAGQIRHGMAPLFDADGVLHEAPYWANSYGNYNTDYSSGRGPLRQERSPLGLTHPPGGQTEDHETDL